MNWKSIIRAALAAIFLLSLGACNTLFVAEDPLNGTSWELYAYRKTRPMGGTAINAKFEDGQVSGSSGCNSYGGAYLVEGNSITITELSATLMACPQPEGIMEQEQVFLEFLGDAQRFEMADGQLQIFRSDGEALTFIPQE